MNGEEEDVNFDSDGDFDIPRRPLVFNREAQQASFVASKDTALQKMSCPAECEVEEKKADKKADQSRTYSQDHTIRIQHTLRATSLGMVGLQLVYQLCIMLPHTRIQ